ncbi:DNA repair protein RecN [Thermodesulfatator atlanticus]|uniref:DNA repair protein RecN n=1 Tax=Thermodesulfatator atlanticus TaxID=501497 RepID=UPI0003B7788C|nr:DNA repair protein RecN [Thermodesulfatator atlanticus]
MLLELRLKDYVLIEEARLKFEPGFVVFTGETGAGKSLLVKSLKLASGARGGPQVIRPGAKQAIIEAVWENSPETAAKLEELGLEPEDEIIIRRVITKERSRIYLNGSPITLQMLGQILAGKVIIAGQHEYQSINAAETRLFLLDAFGGLLDLREKYQKAFKEYQDLAHALNHLREKISSALKEEDFLNFQLKEIENVAPQPGEDEEIEERLFVLKNLARLESLVKDARSQLETGYAAFSQARKSLSQAIEFSRELEPLAKRLESLVFESEDLAGELTSYLRNLATEEGELEALEERLYQLKRLKRKYGPTLQDVLAHYEQIKKELARLTTGEDQLKELEEKTENARSKAEALAEELSLKRKEKAELLSHKINSYLKDLALEGARFRIHFSREELSKSGIDLVDFLVKTNPQSPLRPLREVASGGELSRFFLAIKAAVSQKEATETLVFDEIDAGVGGMVAHKLGTLLKELARAQQVICVTHLPQLAALADQHFVVEKKIEGEKATTRIKELNFQERTKEIARMLGEPNALELARRLLAR